METEVKFFWWALLIPIIVIIYSAITNTGEENAIFVLGYVFAAAFSLPLLGRIRKQNEELEQCRG